MISANYFVTSLSKSFESPLRSAEPRLSDVGASPAAPKPHLAIILPKHRLWEWHRQLALHLETTHDVTIFIDDRAPPYPRAERLWLALEQLVFSSGPLAKPVTPESNWRPASELKDVSGRTVINLSERPHPDTEAIELRYDGVLDSCALIDRLLSQQSPYVAVHSVGKNEAIAAARLAIEEKFLLGSGLQASFSRCVSLIDRALYPTAGQLVGDENTVARTSGRPLVEFVPRMLVHKASNLIMKSVRRREHWQVALRNGGRDFKVVQDDGSCFYADPFLQQVNGRTFLFVEEYPYATRRGVISVAEISGDQILAAPAPVLKCSYHLSYPFVFEHDGKFYMIPETSENRSIELYRAVEFPWKWELDKVLMEGAVFSDATVLFYNDLWWIFVNADWFGTSTQDELSIFYSATLHGEWKPHLANPVKSDSRSSRPAGRVIQQDGRLFRPAQNCDRAYGAGIAWFEITELTPTRFNERKIVDWDGQAELSMNGLHSFDQLGSLQTIDFNCSIGRGAMRKKLPTITPRSGGMLERSFSGESHCFQPDQIR